MAERYTNKHFVINQVSYDIIPSMYLFTYLNDFRDKQENLYQNFKLNHELKQYYFYYNVSHYRNEIQ